MLTLRNKTGFTLIELVIAMTIFSVMTIIVLNVYFHVTYNARKLQATRQLSETAREITERLSLDIRERGVSLSGSHFDDHSDNNELWRLPDYTTYGGEILGIGTEDHIDYRYIYGKMIHSGDRYTIDHCTIVDKEDQKTLCGLYMVTGENWSEAYNLADSFIPEEEKKRVKIEDLRFYISGNEYTTKKVMMQFTLSLMPRIGISTGLVNTTKMHIQTTVSERIYKNYSR